MPTITGGMGDTLGFVAIVVGLGVMIGEIVRVSGDAQRVAFTLINRFGEDRAPLALGLTGFIVAIPVFFDVACRWCSSWRTPCPRWSRRRGRRPARS